MVEKKKKCRGKINFVSNRGFGFIKVPNRIKDIYIHCKSMDSDLFKVGTELEFSLEEKPKGPEAYAVEVIDQCE